MRIRFMWLRWYWLWQLERGHTFFYDGDTSGRAVQNYLWIRCPVFTIRIAFAIKAIP
jgi:hypothetical protein